MNDLIRGFCVGAAVVALLVGCSTDDEATPADTPSEDVTAGDGATTGDGQVDGGEASDASVDDDGGPAPDALYTTCSGTLMCAMEACDDPVSGELSCLTPCLDGSSEDALGGFDVFFQCMAEQCFAGPCAADDAADDCVDVCMKSECAYELIACVDPGTFGDGDCVSGMDCIEECGGEDEAGGAEEYGCIGECFGELQDGAKGDLAGLLSCMGAAEASHEGEGVDPFDSCPTEALQCMTSGETGDEDCVGIVGCLDVCGAQDDDDEGPGCMAACFASGTADAQSAATSLFECIDDADTEEEPPSEDQALACLQEACGTELFGCLADADCTDALGCLGECGEDEDCQLSCFAGLSEDTMTVLTALGECSDANGCLGGGGGESEGDPMADCMPAILECAQPSNDAGTCGEFITCLDSDDDEEDEGMSAFLECIAGTGETAVGHFLTAQQCHESCFEQCDMGPVEGAPGPNPMACLETECASETDACTADIECEAAMFCMSICDGSEEDCEAQCQGALNDEEKALLDAVEACGNANGCLGSALEDGSQDEGACVAEYCGPELEACIADADCQAIFDCHEACDDDDDAADDCQAKCTEGVSAEALALFTAAVECSLNAGCYSDPDDPAGGCVAAACETELTACIVDTECKGVMDCHDTCDEAEDADDACYSACLDGVSAASAALFDATVQCAIASDCWSEPGPGPGNCVGECLASDDCAPAMQACDMGPGPGPGPPPMD